MFSTKDLIPRSLKAQVVYKFTCPGCNASYIGETNRRLSTRIMEHLSKDKSSHIYKHLSESENCRNVSDDNCFIILRRSSSDKVSIENQRGITYPMATTVTK